MTEIKRKRGRPRKERITGTVTWAYKEKVSVPEFLRRLDNLLGSPINQMIECDGDLLMSEYQKLLQARYMPIQRGSRDRNQRVNERGPRGPLLLRLDVPAKRQAIRCLRPR
jgi:hypothetical protein